MNPVAGATILVVEDNPDVHELIRATLTGEGHRVVSARDGLAARAALAQPGLDLVVLDLMLPHVDGSVLLAEIRRSSDIPVLVLSAKDAVFTKVDMLRLGADDYVTKPFDLTELTARIEALLRRSSPAGPTTASLRHGPLRLDAESARVSVNGVEVALTATELRILRLLMQHPGTVFSRPRIYESVWEAPFLGDDSAVKGHLSNLRAKLRDADPATDPIETVWGLGYRMRALH
ncbi:MAG: response regulator transcription factor [Brooklawnia sp.]